MFLTNWIKTAIQEVLAAEVPPLTQDIVTGVVEGLAANTQLVTQIADAVTQGVIAGLTTQIEAIPQDTTTLMSKELQQLPQQIDEVLDIPARIEQAIKNILPFDAHKPGTTK